MSNCINVYKAQCDLTLIYLSKINFDHLAFLGLSPNCHHAQLPDCREPPPRFFPESCPYPGNREKSRSPKTQRSSKASFLEPKKWRVNACGPLYSQATWLDRERMDLGVVGLASNLRLSLNSCMSCNKSFKLTEPQFLYWENEYSSVSLREWVKDCMR